MLETQDRWEADPVESTWTPRKSTAAAPQAVDQRTIVRWVQVVGGLAMVLGFVAIATSNGHTNAYGTPIGESAGGWIGIGLVGIIGGLAAVVIAQFAKQSMPVQTVLTSRLSAEEFDACWKEIQSGKLMNIECDSGDLPLSQKEICHWMGNGILAEPKKQRAHVGGYSHGFFASVPVELKGISCIEGSLYITSRRVVFLGEDGKTVSWTLKQIVSSSITELRGVRGISLATTTHQGDVFYMQDYRVASLGVATLNKVLSLRP